MFVSCLTVNNNRPPRSSKDGNKSRKTKSSATGVEKDVEEDFEEVGDDWSREGSISPGSYHDDVEELLQSFRNERVAESGFSQRSVGSAYNSGKTAGLRLEQRIFKLWD
jgi:hypothetical protein